MYLSGVPPISSSEFSPGNTHISIENKIFSAQNVWEIFTVEEGFS